MRAAAILGTKATARDLREFKLPGVDIVTSADMASDCPCDAALIFGGDGSMHRQLSAAVASQVPVLSVPKGSGNDFARALGLGMPGAALSAWRQFCACANNVRSIDVGEITFPNAAAGNQKTGTRNSLYCCIAGVGLDSEVNRRANALPAWLRGHGGYVLSVPGALAPFRPPEISIDLFDSSGPSHIKEPAVLVAFANSTSYGHGMRMAPRAQLDDGKLDVVFVRRASRLRLLRLFPSVFAGAHLQFPEVVYAQCTGLKIESERPLDIYGDGEFIGRTPAEVHIRPRALRVIVP